MADVDSESPRPVNTTSDAHFFMDGCTIKRSQLDRIWKLACEGFEHDADVVIETERNTGVVSSKISSSSIDDTIEGVRQATLPGDPNYIDNLRLYVSDRYEDTPRRRTVSVYITRKRVHVSVSGADPGWVRGRIEGLKDLFAETRSKWVFGGGDIKYIAVVVGAILSIAPTAAILVNINPSNSGIFILVLAATMGAFIGTGLLFGRWIDRRSRVRLLLFDEPSPKDAIDKVNLTILIVTMIGVIVAILAILIAHHDSTKGRSTGLSPADNLRSCESYWQLHLDCVLAGASRPVQQ
jgi:hypothetical protein